MYASMYNKMIIEKQEYKVGIKYGILLGLIVVSIGIIRYATGMILNEDQRLSYLYWFIFFIVSLVAIFSLKNSNNKLLFGSAIKVGITIGFVSSLMYLLYLLVLNHFIDSQLPERLLEIAKQKMLEQNEVLTPDQIKELAIKQSSSSPLVRGAIYIIVSIFFGVLYSSIGWIVLKLKNKKK